MFGRTALCGALALVAWPACAQATDPYAADVASVQRRRAEQEFERYIDGARTLYFALGCKAITYAPYAEYPIQNNILRFMNRIASADEIAGRLTAARREGLAEAKEGCDRWRDDPEAVIAIRRRSQIGIMP